MIFQFTSAILKQTLTERERFRVRPQMNTDITDLNKSAIQICVTPCSSVAENELQRGGVLWSFAVARSTTMAFQGSPR